MKFMIKFKKISSKVQNELNNTDFGYKCFENDKPFILITNNDKNSIYLCSQYHGLTPGVAIVYEIKSKFENKPKKKMPTIYKYIKNLFLSSNTYINNIDKLDDIFALTLHKHSSSDYASDHSEQLSYKRFCKYIEIISKDYTVQKLSPDNINNFTEILNIIKKENAVKRLFSYENNYDIYIAHKRLGWQQILGNYYYRDIGELIVCNPLNVNSNYQLEYSYNIDINDEIQKQFDVLLNYINSADHKFTMPLFLYMLFSKCKSLFKQYNKNNIKVEQNGFAINIIRNTINPDVNSTAIDYMKRLNKNFFYFENTGDLGDLEFVLSLNKEFTINYKQIEHCISKLPGYAFTPRLQLKSAKLKLSDFPILKFNAKFAKSSRNQIDISTLSAELKSKLSFIYYDIADKDEFFIHINIPANINTELITSFNNDYMTYGFQTIVVDYLNYISKFFNTSRENEIQKMFDSQYSEDDNLLDNELVTSTIQNYINMMLEIEDTGDCNQCNESLLALNIPKLKRFLYKIYNLNYTNFEKLFIATENNNKDYFVSEYEKLYVDFEEEEEDIFDENDEPFETTIEKANTMINDDLNFKTYESGESINGEQDVIITYSEYNNIKQELYEYIYEKYVACYIYKCIFSRSYITKYFDTLYKESLNELSTPGANEKSIKRYAFLLTMLESFNQYLGDQMSEQASQFKDIYDETKELLHTLCKTEDYGTDKYWIKLFAEYLQTEIKQKNIIDVHSNKDAEIGWINEDKGQIYLKNTGKFYDNFMIYAQQCGSNIHHSKTAFIREVLFANHVILSRKDGERKRYDVERKINGEKQNVISVIHNTLTSYLN